MFLTEFRFETLGFELHWSPPLGSHPPLLQVAGPIVVVLRQLVPP